MAQNRITEFDETAAKSELKFVRNFLDPCLKDMWMFGTGLDW